MKKYLLATAMAASLLLAGTVAHAADSDANAGFVVLVAFYKNKCSTPVPEVVNKVQLKLTKNHDYNNEQATNALVDIVFAMNKMGTNAWCQTITKGFQENLPDLAKKLEAAEK
jgi:hypothetical protein